MPKLIAPIAGADVCCVARSDINALLSHQQINQLAAMAEVHGAKGVADALVAEASRQRDRCVDQLSRDAWGHDALALGRLVPTLQTLGAARVRTVALGIDKTFR